MTLGLGVGAAHAAAVQSGDVEWIAVDVGHTLEAPGATSARGRTELEFNRQLAEQLVVALRARVLDELWGDAGCQMDRLARMRGY